MHQSSVSADNAKVHIHEPNVVLIDVRTVEEFNESHVVNSVNIPLDELLDRVEELQGYSTVYVLCRSGARSGYGAELLRNVGIPAVNIAGGILAWNAE